MKGAASKFFLFIFLIHEESINHLNQEKKSYII